MRDSVLPPAVAAGWYGNLGFMVILINEHYSLHLGRPAYPLHLERFGSFKTFYHRVRPWYWRRRVKGNPARAGGNEP